jgi:hypothetical protein
MVVRCNAKFVSSSNNKTFQQRDVQLQNKLPVPEGERVDNMNDKINSQSLDTVTWTFTSCVPVKDTNPNLTVNKAQKPNHRNLHTV